MEKVFRTIKPELVSLVHNIELNNSDWWEKTIQKIIIAVLWIENKETNLTEIKKKIQDESPIKIDLSQINVQIDKLCAKNIILASQHGYRISEAHKQEFENEISSTEQITQKAKEKFLTILSKECSSINGEQLWVAVNKDLLLPSVHLMGARFYELLSGDRVDIDKNFNTENFLNSYAEEYRTGIKNTITTYLSNGDKDVKTYILRYINASFVLEASSLSEKTIDLLKKSTKNKVAFTIFVDTNFIFSLLGYHNNPFNDDASLLSSLVKEAADKVTTQFYIAPITVEETRTAIQNVIDYYDGLRISPNLAKASLDIKQLGGDLLWKM